MSEQAQAPSASCIDFLQQAPHSWLLHFIKQCDDPDTLLALFQTNKQLRDSVIQSAQLMGVQFQLSDESDPQLVSNACQLLLARGRLPTGVTLLLRPVNMQQVQHALQQLSNVHITHLFASMMHLYHPPQQCSTLLTTIATFLPHLTSLHLNSLTAPLPPPFQLPHLSHIHAVIAATRAGILPSISAYLGQLGSLRMVDNDSPHRPFPWHQLITHTSNTLKRIDSNRELTDDMLGLLLAHVPALEEVTVAKVELDQASHRGATWCLKRLTITGSSQQLQCINKLPDTSADSLEVHLANTCPVVLKPTCGLDRLSHWKWTAAKDVLLDVTWPWNWDTPKAQTLAALLPQIAALNTNPTGPRWLFQFNLYDADLQCLQVVTAALAAHPQLAVRVRSALNDRTLDMLVQHGPKGQELEVCGDVAIKSQQHQRALWPWPRVLLHTARLPAKVFACFPDPGSRKAKVDLPDTQYITFNITCSELGAGDDFAQSLSARLRQLDLCLPWQRVVCEVCHVKDREEEPPAGPSPLKTKQQEQSSMVRQLHANLQAMCGLTGSTASPPQEVVLKGWVWDQELVAELSGLPHWNTVLRFGDPLPADTELCAHMARQVPTSFHTWVIWGKLGREDNTLMCLTGIATGRGEGVRPPRVKLPGHKWEEVQRMRGSLEQAGLDLKIE